MHGLISDVCLKRKVRNFIDAMRGSEQHYKIYVQNSGYTLNELHRRAYTAAGIKATGSKQSRDQVFAVRRWMCQNFYDIRAFGAVMSTRINCGQVRGPVQLTFARSIDPVLPLDLSITRVTVTSNRELTARESVTESGAPWYGSMGRKPIVLYGLYRCFGFINPVFAHDTGFSCEDLALFWRSLLEMWDFDRAAGRGLMACRGLYVFSHSSRFGNAPADELFSLLEINRNPGVTVPRSFADYVVSLRREKLPRTVELNELKHLYAEGSNETTREGRG
jgi:CRISPR-associated protein Csd2